MASLRGAAGRAYYAAFVFARDLLVAAKFRKLADNRAHKKVADLLKASAIPDVRKAGFALSDLHRQRKIADYELQGAHDDAFRRRSDVEPLVLQARWIISVLEVSAAADVRLRIEKSKVLGLMPECWPST